MNRDTDIDSQNVHRGSIANEANEPNNSRDQIPRSGSLRGLPIRSESNPDGVDIHEKPLPNDDINWENLPGERKIRKTSFIICFLTAVGVIFYGIIESTETDFKISNETMSDNETTMVCTREERRTFPVFFHLGLGLLGIIVGVFVDRFSLLLEELFKFKSRYNRSFLKVLRSCFSGISWKVFTFVTLIVAASFSVGRKTAFRLADTIYVLGGIGVGPLVVHLLNLNSESEIAVSTILETKKMYPGYILAWSYYFITLRKEIKHFNDKILKAHPSVGLDFKRMILLLTPGTDIKDIDDLILYDEKIQKYEENEHGKLPLYKLTLKPGEHKLLAMICVREPLVALKQMKEAQKVKFVNDTTFEDELKRFYKTLSEILEDGPDDKCRRKGLAVPVTVKIGHYHELKHGGLVRIIMAKVNASTVSNNSGLLHPNKNRMNTVVMKKRKEKKEKISKKNKQDIDERKPLNPGNESSSGSEQDPLGISARTSGSIQVDGLA